MERFRANHATEDTIQIMQMSEVAARGATSKVSNQCAIQSFYFKRFLYKPKGIECVKPGYSANHEIRLKDESRTGIKELEFLGSREFYPGAIKQVDKLFKQKFPVKQLIKEQPKSELLLFRFAPILAPMFAPILCVDVSANLFQ